MRHKILRLALSLLLIAAMGLLYLPLVGADLEPRTLPAPEPVVEARASIEMARVTYYNAVEGQTDSTPDISACGPNLAAQVAVSRDLFRGALDCGDVVEVWLEDGYLGRFVVWDTMAPRFERTLDILTEGSYTWGKTTGHLIVID